MIYMSYKEIFDMISEIGLPAAYNHFTETGKPAPYICFYYPESRDFFADDENYTKIESLYIELYTGNKSLELEATVESVLRDHKITYSRAETYLDAEQLYLELYTMEIYINEEI